MWYYDTTLYFPVRLQRGSRVHDRLASWRLPSGGEEANNLDLSLSDYPHSKYSPDEVAKAGKLVALNVIVDNQVPDDVRTAFLVANNWRNAHAFPMRSIHGSVRYYVGANNLDAITAARLKRMAAIRRKLGRITVKLHKLQDLGGCRIILPSVADTRLLVDTLRKKLPSAVVKESDYISDPKRDGYRSHHIIFSFRRSRPTPFDGLRIEVQVRTRLQHSWATAVEAVGLYRGEELKNQKGNGDWLRLFALMSAEFAEVEDCATVPGTPDPRGRRREIKNLEKSLGALTVLESVTKGFHGADVNFAPGYKPTHYLIRFDHSSKTVHVDPYNQVGKATLSYDQAEESLRAGDQNDVVALVEVDKIKNLKAAYPNYFGDVDIFQRQLRKIVLGGVAVEYKRLPKQSAQKSPREPIGSFAWTRGTRFPKPSRKNMERRKQGRNST